MRSLYLGGLAATLLCSVAFAPSNDGGAVDPKEEINKAIRQLDAENDADWTGGGMPSLDRVSELVGRKVSRQEVTDAKPGYLRPSTDQAGATKDAGPTEAQVNDLAKIGAGNPMDAANNAEREILGKDDPRKAEEADGTTPGLPSAAEIAERIPDAILLMEAAVAVGFTGRYSRNSTLLTLLRGYQTSQAEIKSTQGRVDQRLAERADAAAKAAEHAKAAEAKSQVPA